MHRLSLSLSFVLVACAPSDGAVDDAKLDALSTKLDDALSELERTSERLEALETKLDAVSEAQQAAASAPTPTPNPALVAARPTNLDPGKLDPTQHIRCEAERCTIQQALLDELLDRPELAARLARVVPAAREGQVVGYKLYGIRPESVPKLLGFKNGDMLTAIAGQPLSSLDAAMAAYEKLRGVSEFEIVFESRDEAKTLTIVIE